MRGANDGDGDDDEVQTAAVGNAETMLSWNVGRPKVGARECRVLTLTMGKARVSWLRRVGCKVGGKVVALVSDCGPVGAEGGKGGTATPKRLPTCNLHLAPTARTGGRRTSVHLDTCLTSHHSYSTSCRLGAGMHVGATPCIGL